jgi:putative ABC transport system substrate-binding protein
MTSSARSKARPKYSLVRKSHARLIAIRIRLLGFICLALLTVAHAVEAQDRTVLQRIAFLSSDSPLSPKCTSSKPHIGFLAFLEGLRSLGYKAGENVSIDCRSAEGKYERLDALAAELIQLNPAVIVAGSAPASLAAKRVTASIPIVSVYTADPVGLGLVASLARPGANVTGISALASDYAAKSLQLLKEAAPRISRVGVLGQAANPTYAIYRRELEPAGRGMGLALDFVGVEAPGEIEAALSVLQRRGADAFLVMHQPFTFEHRERIVKLVARFQLPAMYGSREAVEAGGLLSYAVSVPDTFRRAAFLVDKVLHGAKPADLPVEQPTTFELAINLKTAKSLGLAMPPSLLLRADEVIH